MNYSVTETKRSPAREAARPGYEEARSRIFTAYATRKAAIAAAYKGAKGPRIEARDAELADAWRDYLTALSLDPVCLAYHQLD